MSSPHNIWSHNVSCSDFGISTNCVRKTHWEGAFNMIRRVSAEYLFKGAGQWCIRLSMRSPTVVVRGLVYVDRDNDLKSNMLVLLTINTFLVWFLFDSKPIYTKYYKQPSLIITFFNVLSACGLLLLFFSHTSSFFVSSRKYVSSLEDSEP
jgi:hypothetical protein